MAIKKTEFEELTEEFEENTRIVNTGYIDDDANTELSLRPITLDEYVGQESVKEQLKISIEATKQRNQALDHVLLYGPPGLGKTTLSNIIAHELGVNIRITSGPAIEKMGDLAALLTSLQENDVLFIDEIHRLPRTVEEVLYPAMEDYTLDFFVGKGPSARSIRMPLAHFTLVGATTRAGQLSTPLRDRFGIQHKLELYTHEELKRIITRSASILDVSITEDGALELAKRSRGTPRIANRLLKRVRDYAQVKGNGDIDLDITNYALEKLDIDELGLDSLDRRILSTIIKYYNGGPVGLETLSVTIGEEAITIEDVYEPYLIQIGFIKRTPRGRCVTKLAYDHLHIPFTSENANRISLFD